MCDSLPPDQASTPTLTICVLRLFLSAFRSACVVRASYASSGFILPEGNGSSLLPLGWLVELSVLPLQRPKLRLKVSTCSRKTGRTMARTKQVAWKSTGGKAPKQQLAAKAARISEHGFEMREVLDVRAESRDRFVGRVPGEGMTEFEVRGVDLHPAIRGFLKLLGRDIFVPLEDLAILVDGDGSPSGGTEITVDPFENEVIFEQMRVQYRRTVQGASPWSVFAAGQLSRDWNRVSALTYHAEIGGASISFTEFANADPTERSQFNMEAIGAAEMMWNGFKNCKSRILMRVAKNPERRYVEAFSFPQGFHSPIRPSLSDRQQWTIRYSRWSTPSVACIPASLSNLICHENPGLAAKIISKSQNEMFGSLRDLSSWVRRTDIFQKGEIYFEIVHCLPETLNHFSSRDPSNLRPGSQEQAAKDRLQWLLAQTEGRFLVGTVTSTGHSSHVVGVNIEAMKILDHENRMSMPFNQEGLDSTCEGESTCIGLREVRKIALKPQKKTKRAGSKIIGESTKNPKLA